MCFSCHRNFIFKINHYHKECQNKFVKINIVVNWFNFVNFKNVQSFLKFVNFYRKFIYDYNKFVVSLIQFIKKNVAFQWFFKCQIVFDVLKKTFIFDVVFRHYNSNLKIVIEIDVSNYVFENILFQYDAQDVFHFIVYFFKKHNLVECNYKIYDKKLMIIVRVFEKWRSKFENFIYFVDVIINHKNFKYFMSIKQFNRRQIRWSVWDVVQRVNW